ncbi:MHYT domain-containing protein [Streptomyces odontomachi]|uniref:MHYT domain-containing protein n=1 Tax=Streptomyces odontomachi TaxID=2944940 RepID=UPI00210ACE1A|nr:MHYT domain-containing protein [Streptomyces sp. ODS25]
MYATAWDFGRELGTFAAAFLASCLGGALGLHCLLRSLRAARLRRMTWLVLSAAAIGAGIWVTHTVGMMHFSADGRPVGYDPLTLYASLGVAIVMIGIGMFIVGHRGITGTALFTGGTLTGLGIASLHYLSMAGVRFGGRLEYNTLVVAASVLISVLAATVALWAVGQRRGRRWDVGAALAMGLAGIGMHYVGMASVRVRLYTPAAAGAALHGAGSPVRTLAVLLIGPVAFLALLTVLLLTRWRPASTLRADDRDPAPARRLTFLPAQRSGQRAGRADPHRSRSGAGQNR